MKKYLKTLFSFLFVFSLILIPSSSFAQTGDIDPNPSTTECVSLENNLRYRDRDSTKNGEVSLLQDFLQSKGYLNSEPTGYFGILTFKAVKDFQRDNGINPTGYVGSVTRAKIVNLTCTLVDPLTPADPLTPYPPNTNFPPGCTSSQGYSPITGVKCDGTESTTFPPGCNSNQGYSPTTGQPCGNITQTGMPRYSVTPTTLVLGSTYTMGAQITDAPANSPIYFYLQRPDGTLKYNNYNTGYYTTGTGYWAGDKSIAVTGVQVGTYTSWLVIGGQKTNTVTFNVTTASTPSITISASSGNQTTDSLTVNIGDVFTISGTPRNLQGTNPSDFSRAYFFNQEFGNNNRCGNNEALANNKWTMTCTATVAGNSYFYIEIYKDGQTYRSNTVNVKINSTTTPSITVLYPNGGEGVFTAGQEFIAKWTSTGLSLTDKVYIGLIQENTNGYYSLTNETLNDGSEVLVIPSNVPAGKYKLYVRKPYTAIDDYSDNFFTINIYNPSLFLGDVNNDGDFNCTDVTWITESVLQNRVLTAEQKKRADMNGDGNVSTLDAVLLSQRYGLNCGTTTTPSITVLSPNGGEVYQAGQQITVKWKSNNLGSHRVGIQLVYLPITAPNVPNSTVMPTILGNLVGLSNPTVNDGIEVVTLPTMLPHIWASGLQEYYIQVITVDGGISADDYSDQRFIINPATPSLQQGDVNGDGLINCTDTTWITESVLQNRVLTAEQKKRADMNGDGNVSTLDAVLLSQRYGLNCGTTTTPSITVLSPNGGEVYQAGQQITVKWKTENIAPTEEVFIGMNWPGTWNLNFGITALRTVNDGIESFYLPTTSSFYTPGGLQYGQFFKVNVTAPNITINNISVFDQSDNLFTVTPQIISDPDPTLQQGDVNGDELINCTDVTWITESVLQNRVLTAEQKKRADMNGDGNVTTLDGVLLSQKYGLNCGTTIPLIALLSPNGGEVYTVGQTMNIKWTSSNMPSGAVTRLMLVRNLPNNAQDIYQIIETTNNIDIKTGSYLWQIPSNIIPASNYFMTIVCGLGDTNCQAVNNISSTMTDTSNLFTINAPTTLDSTPRIAYWGGKVGQHTDREGNWISDPDGTSGVVETDAGRLTYCKKWYPNTSNVTAYKTETITTWKRSIFNEQSNYTNTVTTYKCIEAFGYNTPNNSKLSSILGSSLQANALGAVNNTNTNQTASQIAPKALSVPVLSCTSFTLLLEQKMNNNEVKCLQKLLNEKGYKVTENGKETTYFGSVTLSALEKFQKDNNLKVDGKFGLESSRILMK